MKVTHALRIRTYPDAKLPDGRPYPWVSIWLLRRDGAGTEGMMYGRVMPDKLRELLDLFDRLEDIAVIEREVCKLAGPATEDESCEKPDEQTLFDAK